jgi:hypothetical protein
MTTSRRFRQREHRRTNLGRAVPVSVGSVKLMHSQGMDHFRRHTLQQCRVVVLNNSLVALSVSTALIPDTMSLTPCRIDALGLQ